MYIIHEYQTDMNGNTTIVEPAPKREDVDEALSVFFLTCSYAAVSKIPYHTVILNYHNGNQIKIEVFEHIPESSSEE